MLRDAIRASLAQSWRAAPDFVAHRLCSRGAFRPEGMHFKQGLVYKTHAPISAFPLNSQVRMVFIYGPASDAALSVLAQDARHGREWTEAHLKHLYISDTVENVRKNIVSRDALQLESQVQAFRGHDGPRRLVVKYETLWDHVEEVADYVGLPIVLPPQESRRSAQDLPPEVVREVKENYRRIDRRFDENPDIEFCGNPR